MTERAEELLEDDDELELPKLRAPQEHAAGELDVPDGVQVLEGAPVGGRKSVAVVVAKFNGELTSRLLASALEELDAAGVPRRRHRRAGAGSVRAPAGDDGAGEDAPVRVRRRARRGDPRRDAALRLRRRRGRVRAPALGARDRRARSRSAS